MRIYSKKQYFIVSNEPGAPEEPITGEQLREHVRLGDLCDGDRIYEAQLFATVKERREIILVEVEPVQPELGVE